jgi:opacity protein-like surface antigen
VPPSFAASGDHIGSAIRIVNDVTGELNSTPRPLATGDGVQQEEAIAAAPNGLAELRLDDSSKIAVGPGARLVLDKFVYDPSANNGTISLNLVVGAFRFITGLASKKDYLLKTPSASISVRGTIFDVYVASDGATYILLHEGSISACNRGGQCVRLDNPCGVVRIANDAKPDALDGFNRLSPAQRPDFAIAFPFVVSPPTIDPTPRFTRTAVESGSCEREQKTPRPLQRAEAEPPKRHAAIRSAPRPAPEPVVETSAPIAISTKPWSGAYAGLAAGMIWQRSDPYLDCDDFTPGTIVCSTNTSFNIPANAYRAKTHGFMGGGQVGYNFQFGNVVVGAEADMAYTDINATSRYDQVFVFPCCTITRGSYVHQELNSLSTVRGRLGYAFDNVLVYATGGLAVGQVDYKFQLAWPDIAGTAGDQKSDLAVGYTGGAGIEVRFGSWSVKTEYLFYDLGQESLEAPFYLGGVVQPFTFRPRFETEGHIVRIGTNFHFD